jgi:hypothetical protein
MAELVPVVGAILLAFKKLKDETVSEVAALGELTQAIASADASISRPIEQLGDAAKSAADKIFLMNPAASVFIAAIGEATSQFGQLVGALDKTAKRYEEFSPELAVSSAMAEVRQTFGDLRRAQQVGPGLARFVDAQSRLQQRVEDLKADLLEKLLPAVVNILEALNRTVGGVDAGIQIMQAIADHGILTQADIRRILEKIKERDGARITEEMFRRIAAGQLADIQAMANLGQGFQEGGQ